MYSIKISICNRLLMHPVSSGFPNRKVIGKYRNGTRKAQENTVRALADILGVSNWRTLVY